MQNKDSEAIVGRFFLAIETMKRDKVLGGLTPFCARYGIDKRNLYKLKDDRTRDIFQVGWLLYLVRDFGINPDWLLAGTGDFYREKPRENRKRKKAARKGAVVHE